MPENTNLNDQKHYDDELARFADQVVGGEQPEVPAMDSSNQEMVELMQTVVSLNRVFKAERPDPAMARRIRANLLKEWEVSGPAAEQDSFWKRLWSGQMAQPQMVTAIGVAALVVVAAGAVFLSSFGSLTTGGSGGQGPVPTVLIVGGLVVLAGVLWLLSRPRR